MPSDEALMLDAGRGDMAAFETLVTRHERTALSIAYRFLGDRMEAEDVAQEAFLRLLESAKRYKPTASFRTYLYAIVARLCCDRARRRMPVCVADPPEPEIHAPPEDELAARRERDRAVRTALDRLPPRQRLAIVLRHYEGLDYGGIAAAMGVSAKAVERLLARARADLAEMLGRRHEEARKKSGG
jgi:RNA polymerase sigma-70 factor (ECF subfamily)